MLRSVSCSPLNLQPPQETSSKWTKHQAEYHLGIAVVPCTCTGACRFLGCPGPLRVIERSDHVLRGVSCSFLGTCTTPSGGVMTIDQHQAEYNLRIVVPPCICTGHCWFWGCPGPLRVVERSGHILRSVSCNSLKSRTATSRDVIEMDQHQVECHLHIVLVSKPVLGLTCMRAGGF